MAELTLYFNVIESFMTCNICNRTIKAEEPDGPVMVLPCLHSFCGICHKSKKNKIGSCTACGKEEGSVVHNELIMELAERYNYFKEPLNKKLKWMKARIDKNFIV